MLFGAGAALGVHRPSAPPAAPRSAPREDLLTRTRREEQLTAAEASVRLLRGLEAHLAERRAGP